MIGVRQMIGHMIVIVHPTDLDVWSVLFVLQPANHNAGKALHTRRLVVCNMSHRVDGEIL